MPVEGEEFDFDAAMAAKGLGEPETTEESDETEEVQEAPAAEADTAAPASSDEPQLILGKFKTAEELAAAYRELEEFKGRQGQEVGDLRREIDSLRQQMPQQTYQPVDATTVEALDQLAETNPHQAAEWARTYAPHLYDRVLTTWFDSDARSASRYENALMVQQMQQEVEKKFAEPLQPLQAQAAQQQFEHAWTNVARKYPDMADYQDAMVEAAQHAPQLAAALMEGDLTAKERNIENLLLIARGKQADQRVVAATEAAQAAASGVAAEKVAATVASTSSAPARVADKGTKLAEWKKAAFLDPEPTSYWATPKE